LSDVEEGTRESSRVVRYSPECVEIEVEMAGGGLLVLNDLYYPGWRAEVSGDARQGSLHPPVLRANRVMRAVPLSAGRHRVTFRYRPASFAAGLLLSILGWSAALALGATCLSARRRPPINAGRLSCCSK
jgi:uncharacterized membrane protein YfhO